jgi:hypothetical protein
MNADNASANDKQTDALAKLDNSFNADGQVQCFNHTAQLSARSLIRPFNPGMTKGKNLDDANGEVEQNGSKIIDEDDDRDHTNLASVLNDNVDNNDDGIDELDSLDGIEKEDILADTEVVREAVSKLRQLSFAIINSMTIALLAWRCHCKDANLLPNLIPHDVLTHWNSTFNMMEFALHYR